MLAGESEVELFFNECSLHGQFSDIQALVAALDTLMMMRQVARKYNRELCCHRSCQQAAVTHQLSLPQAIQQIDKNKARVLMGWFSKTGPYWEDYREHPDSEFFECNGEVVTDTAIGECAYMLFSYKDAQLTSVSPSNWSDSPIVVTWHKNDKNIVSKPIINHASFETLEVMLKKADRPLQSWDELALRSKQRFENLHFTDETFKPLKGTPFVLAAAKSLFDLLEVLSLFKTEHKLGSDRTQEGHELYQTYFHGQQAWFTDSSDSEKLDFKKEMTFIHPKDSSQKIFAPFHGKVQTPQMRIHFTWPINADDKVYILYIGEKITKY